MKILMHNIKLLAFSILILTASHLNAKKAEIEKSKAVNKTFTVKQQQTIQLSNKFGEMNIVSWDKNEVEVSISIRVGSSTEKRTQELLDNINIDIQETDSKLSIVTNLKDGDQKVKMKVKNSHQLNIDYNIKVPASNYLEITNAFGSLSLTNMIAKVKINQSFGSASIGNLNSDQNELSFKFCDPVIINSMNGGELSTKYSKLELASTNNLQLESQMCEVKIAKINSKASFDVKYGSLTLDHLAEGMSELDIKGEFSPIKITLNNQVSYAAELISKLSKLKLPRGVKHKETTDNLKSSYKGILGENGTTNCSLKVQSSFGNININYP